MNPVMTESSPSGEVEGAPLFIRVLRGIGLALVALVLM